MRIERGRPILSGYRFVITAEISGVDDPILKIALKSEGLSQDDIIVNIANGNTYVYLRA